jgi:organic radical activating enzyme
MDEKEFIFEKDALVECGSKEHIYIFGCSEMGKIGKKVLESFGLKVRGFLDNNEKYKNQIVDDLQVLNPKETLQDKELEPICVAICVFNDETEKIIENQLRNLGIKKFINKNMIMYYYLRNNLKPTGFRVDKDQLIESKGLTIAITEFCTLKCKYCGEFTPYFNNPKHYDIDLCIKSIRNLLKGVKYVHHISIIGGEPLLHPHLQTMLENVVKCENIGYFEVISNGTIVPSESLCAFIGKHNPKVQLAITSYGSLNKKIDEIKSICEKFNIKYRMHFEEVQWDKGYVPTAHNRTVKQNRDIYATCINPDFCPLIMNGNLYKCMTAAVGIRLGRAPFIESDCVNLVNENDSAEQIRNKLYQFILKTDAITACDYCYQGELEKIPRGEQIKEKVYDLSLLLDEQTERR